MDEVRNGEAGASATDAQGNWKKAPGNENVMTHPSGWQLTCYSVFGKWRYLLWDGDGKPHGPYYSPREGMDQFACIGPKQWPGPADATSKPTVTNTEDAQ